MERPTIAPSAHRHDVTGEEMVHAFDNPISVEHLDDDLIMIVGPDHAGTCSRSAS